MKTGEDFRREMAEGEASFRLRVEQTLLALPDDAPVMKRRISAGLAVAFALLMMTVAALAANWWGIGEFLNRDDLGMMTVDSAFSTETRYATFTVTEHIYDGRGVYFVLAVRPVEEKTLLLPAGTARSSTVDMLVPEEIGTGVTCGDYAAAHGFEQIRWVDVELMRNGERLGQLNGNNMFRLQEDGTLLMMVFTLVNDAPEELTFTIDCGSHMSDLFYHNWQEKPRISVQHMDVAFTRQDVAGRAWRSAAPVAFDQVDAVVDEVRIVETPMISYFTIDYTVNDGSNGRLMYLTNAEGRLRAFGNDVFGMKHFVLDEEQGRYRWLGTVKLTDKILEAFYIRATKGSVNFPEAKEIRQIHIVPAE